ncbi:GATA zinc finger protein 3 [Fusarium irregulare]|uniref:GATA zinc finger protein 3 n=1 Tax=Fusarium irregulare TaxID=2494466 RepID=A0A9W8UDQ0_9HYPO|nr:GATA zinc finger protein 3 [Fusarium irregulare]KAJ4020573.1 GATA zinc finger protein 3 [Fusarium irregulare]
MEEDGTQILAQAALDPISRPESTSTSASNLQHGLPGISALAAANAATDATAQLRASVAASPAMYPTASPAATSGGSGSTMPTCHNCSTSTTPLWRRDEFGAVLCNACGLFLKLHGRARPISLKTDVIKSRNRVKTMRPDLAAKKKAQQQQQQQGTQGFGTTDANGYDTTGQAAAAAAHAARQASQNNANGHDGDSPRTGTPSMYAHGLSSFMVDDPYPSGYAQTAEGHTTLPMNGDRKNDASQSREQLVAQNATLKTRVSELEVIMDLLQGRYNQEQGQVAKVEYDQVVAEREAARESEAQLRKQLEDSHRRENILKRRLDDLELELHGVHSGSPGSDERPAKRPRTTDDDEPYKTQLEKDIKAAADALLASDASRSHEVTEHAPAQSSEAAQSLEETKQADPAPETDDVPIDPDMPMMDDAGQSEAKVQAPEDAGVDAPAATDKSSEAADDTEAAVSETAAASEIAAT